MRIIGLDIGTVRIGVAVSDEMGWTAQPIKVINVKDGKEFDEIAALIDEYNPSEIVVGLPLNMNGSEGPMALKVKEYKQQLEEKFAVSVVLWDERLSTVSAERMLIEGDVSRKKRKNVVDKIAAAIILKSYLDSR